MALPEPVPGLVICYSYLWHNERQAGRDEGRKDRPAAIVIVRKDDLAVPITHTQPAANRRPVELPRKVRRALRLDDKQSWIVTDELNQFIWPGFDLRPISRDTPDRFHYGYLPTEIFDAVKSAILANRAMLRRVQR